MFLTTVKSTGGFKPGRDMPSLGMPHGSRNALGGHFNALIISGNFDRELDGIAVNFTLIVDLALGPLYVPLDAERDVVPVDLAIFNHGLAKHVAGGFAGQLATVHLKDESQIGR